jgi:hypothetical protein
MNSRERVAMALNHQEPDRVPLDLGGCEVTSMHASTVYRLRQALALDPPRTPVKVTEPYQMLGEIRADLLDALGADVIPLAGKRSSFGFDNEDWKPWTLFDGTPVLVASGFNTDLEPDGSLLLYPEGDRSAPPCARMPHQGWYFDPIIRQPPIDEDRLNPEDNVEEFGLLTGDALSYFATEAERLYRETDRALFAALVDTSFGDVGSVPGPGLKQPKGIRDVEEWYVSLHTRPRYIRHVFERQCEVALANLERFAAAVGNRVCVLFVNSTDFGMQTGPLISPRTYRELFQPFHKVINSWVHEHTTWKTFNHSCGSVLHLIEDFIGAGFDILNPVQCSAHGMDPAELKRCFGDRLTFWGGGVDTQRTLPFGTPEEVRREVLERVRIFGRGGGFIFNAVHNIQAGVPVENIIALFDAFRDCRDYPLGRER